MASSYVDRLTAEFDEITSGVTAVLERAADEGRDVTADENAQIERDDARREELQRAIDHYAGIAERTAKVSAVRDRVSTLPNRTNAAVRDEPYDITREFPTAGDYAATVHAAWVRKDPAAIEKLERATAHQTTEDNPGLIPRPIIGPLVNGLSRDRPTIASVANRNAPTGKFDRPRIDQHVDVQKQTAEKAETASREMLIGTVPVSLDTFAGHLNISKQDIRWTQPSILQVVFDDFTRMYARRTNAAAATEFPTLITATQPVADWTPDGVRAFLTGAQALIMAGDGGFRATTAWMSLDVWQELGGVTMPVTSLPAFNLPLTGDDGDLLGFRSVLDPDLPAGTLIVGDRSQAEVWEDLEGFLSVDEPSVLGQLVGYAGYMDFVVLDADAFVKAVVPAG
jgi:HK97 family phage major capsid protein